MIVDLLAVSHERKVFRKFYGMPIVAAAIQEEVIVYYKASRVREAACVTHAVVSRANSHSTNTDLAIRRILMSDS